LDLEEGLVDSGLFGGVEVIVRRGAEEDAVASIECRLRIEVSFSGMGGCIFLIIWKKTRRK